MNKGSIIAALLVAGSIASAGPVLDHYRKVTLPTERAIDISRSKAMIDSTEHGITEIAFERPKSLNKSRWRAFSVVIDKDGTFEYEGYDYVDRIGKHTGTISPAVFNRLAQFIDSCSYSQFAPFYSREAINQPTTYTMVLKRGSRKAIGNHAQSGPIELWAVEQLVEWAIAHGQWD